MLFQTCAFYKRVDYGKLTDCPHMLKLHVGLQCCCN